MAIYYGTQPFGYVWNLDSIKEEKKNIERENNFFFLDLGGKKLLRVKRNFRESG